MNKAHRDKLLSYGLIRFVSLPAAIVPTIILVFVLSYFRVFTEQTAVWILLILTVIEVLAWVVWVIRSIKKSNKDDRSQLWIISATIVLIYAGCIAYGYDRIFGYELDMVEKSPCGNYKVEVYIPRVRFAMPGGGGFYSNPTRIKLKNKWGWTIGQSDESNSPLYGDLEFEWDYENNYFWYSRGNAIEF